MRGEEFRQRAEHDERLARARSDLVARAHDVVGGEALRAHGRRTLAVGTLARMRILAVYAGRAAPFELPARTIRSAIVKAPVAGPVAVGPLGLAGDEQVSPGHGGPDRAVCVYPSEHLGIGATGSRCRPSART